MTASTLPTLDVAGLDHYNTARVYNLPDGDLVTIALHGTRWHWTIHRPDGTVAAGVEATPGQAARFATHALTQGEAG